MDIHNVDHVVMRDAEEVLQYSFLGTSTRGGATCEGGPPKIFEKFFFYYIEIFNILIISP